jgi:hypothetical protein
MRSEPCVQTRHSILGRRVHLLRNVSRSICTICSNALSIASPIFYQIVALFSMKQNSICAHRFALQPYNLCLRSTCLPGGPFFGDNTARLLDSFPLQVKAHGLYHACKAKRDGLQDRCKACRAELDKHRLQQARFNSAATAAGSSSVARPRIVGLTRSGSTPTSHVSSGSSPKRRSLKSSSGGSGEHDCSLPLSSEAVAAVAAADATVTAAAAAAAMAASRDDRPVKRRRYPQWNLPAETRSEPSSTWQPLPELPTVVPR